MYASIQEIEEPLERRAADAGEALRQNICAQKHRGAHRADRQRPTHAGGVAAEQVHLQHPERVPRDGRFGERTKAGVDAVHRRVRLCLPIDNLPRRIDDRRRLRREPHDRVVVRHREDLVQRQRRTIKADHSRGSDLEMTVFSL
jgi:hypothetical protein